MYMFDMRPCFPNSFDRNPKWRDEIPRTSHGSVAPSSLVLRQRIIVIENEFRTGVTYRSAVRTTSYVHHLPEDALA